MNLKVNLKYSYAFFMSIFDGFSCQSFNWNKISEVDPAVDSMTHIGKISFFKIVSKLEGELKCLCWLESETCKSYFPWSSSVIFVWIPNHHPMAAAAAEKILSSFHLNLWNNECIIVFKCEHLHRTAITK